MDGDDELDGGAGDDLLVGGPGADMLKGGANAPATETSMSMGDTISYIGSPAGVTINLRAGTARGGDADGDTLGEDIENIQGSMYDDRLAGDRGDNMLWGLGGNDDLSGERGDDDLFGGMGDDVLDGEEGDDTLEGGPGADELTGGDGADTASWAGSAMGVTVRLHSGQIMGGDAEGDTFGDMVTVEYDNPDLEADPDERVLEETVPDFIHLIGSANADILAGDSRNNNIQGGAGDDKLYGGPGGGNDILTGGPGDDMLFGGIGGDTLNGNAGDDTLVGGSGVDTLNGGAGDDMFYADITVVGNAPTADTITEDADEGTDTVSFARLSATEVTYDLPANIENLIGTSEDDRLTGNGENNTIEGGDGADVLDGTTGGTNTVSYENSDRRVNIDLSVGDSAGRASGGHAQGDDIDNFQNITGSAHDDNLTGDSDPNTIKGLAGDDEIFGLAGADTVEGGAGADELDGGTHATDAGANNDGGADRDGDTLSYASSDAGVRVRPGCSYPLRRPRRR